MEIAKLYFNAILLLGFFSVLFVGVAVYSRNRKDIINKVWSAVCFSVSLWCLFYFLTINAETKNSAIFLIRVANLFGVLVFIFWLYFVAAFLNIQKDKKFKLFYGFMIIFSIAVSYLIMSPWFMKDIVPTYIFNYYLIPDFGYVIYAIYFLFATIGGLSFLFSHRKQFTGIKAGQFNFITFGSLIGFIGGGVAFLPSFGIYFPVYLLILFTTFPIIIAYGITKYNLFNIRVIATEAFIVAIWILLIYRSIVSYSSYQDFFINIGSLILIVAVGILLMRSVMREVEQREKIEKIEKEIERAYEIEKRAKEELEVLGNVKNQFLMTIQHHLRTPLTSMRGYADLLLSGSYGKMPKKTEEVIKKFEGSTTSLIKMVNDFLDITQFQLGKEVVALKDGVNLPEILDEIVKDMELEAKKKGIYLKIDGLENNIAIKADESKLKAALVNIFDNAIKYTKEGGVEIKLKTAGEKVKIEIKDTGMGITKERLPKLFDSTFERTEESKKTFATGRGIGLFLSAQIIKAHNGKIWAESEGEGKGSTFNIELPLTE